MLVLQLKKSFVMWSAGAPDGRMNRPLPMLLHLFYEELMSQWSDLTHLSLFVLSSTFIPSNLFFLSLLFPSFCPSLEGEESRRFIKAPVWGSGQEKASLPSFVPSHPQSLAGQPGRRGNRPCPASTPPPSPRPLRFLPHGVTGASRFLPHRERHVRGHRAGAFAQEVRLSGHQFPQVSPGNPGWQRTDGSPAWAQTLVKREVSTWSNSDTGGGQSNGSLIFDDGINWWLQLPFISFPIGHYLIPSLSIIKAGLHPTLTFKPADKYSRKCLTGF